MVMRKRGVPRGVLRKRRVVRRRLAIRRPISRGNVPDKAMCSVKTTILPVGGGPYAANIMYNINSTIQLINFARALTISKAYQLYRISKVRITFTVPYDTYQAGAGAQGKPNLYFMVDKSGTFPLATTIDMLKQAGARPRVVDNKPTSVQFKPSVLTEEETLAGPVAAQYKLSPWLATDANTVNHRGLWWILDQQFPAGNGVQYEAELEVQFEFKKPLWTAVGGNAPNAISSVPHAVNYDLSGVSL